MGRGAEWVDEVWDKIFFFGAGANGLLFVSYNDLVIGDFDNFGARNNELWIEEAFQRRALDENLLNGEVVVGHGVIDDFAKTGAFLGLDLEAWQGEIKRDDFANRDDVVFCDQLVTRIDDDAEIGIFADTPNVENVGTTIGE